MSPPRLRILMVGPRLAARGGVASVCGALAQSVPGRDCDFEYVGTVGGGSLAARIAQSVAGVVRASASLLVSDVSVVHLHTASRGSFWRKASVAAVASLVGCPIVIHIHGAKFRQFAVGGGRFRRRSLEKFLASAARVVVLSQEMEAVANALAPRVEVLVLPNPVEVPPTAADGDAKHVLFAGRLGERKGSSDLIAAFARIEACHPEWRLTLAGDGDLHSALALVRGLDAEDRIRVAGWLSGLELSQLRSSASVFCLPSRDEGLPVALLEAMAAGMCCVVSPVGGIPEHVEDGVSGLFVAPGDCDALTAALEGVMGDQDLRLALGEAARRHVVDSCSLELVTGALLEMWTTVVEEHAS